MRFDINLVQWLAAMGALYDIVGALILARAIIFSRAATLSPQTETHWGDNRFLLKGLSEQVVDARCGGILLLFGFGFQAASAFGLTIMAPIAGLLFAVLCLVIVGYFLCRRHLVRRQYMMAVERSKNTNAEKDFLRRAFGSLP
jgi:hypothetical protein